MGSAGLSRIVSVQLQHELKVIFQSVDIRTNKMLKFLKIL